MPVIIKYYPEFTIMPFIQQVFLNHLPMPDFLLGPSVPRQTKETKSLPFRELIFNEGNTINKRIILCKRATGDT